MTRFTISLVAEVQQANGDVDQIHLERISNNDVRVDGHQLWVTQQSSNVENCKTIHLNAVFLQLICEQRNWKAGSS